MKNLWLTLFVVFFCSLSTFAQNKPQRMLILGNSITKHPAPFPLDAPYWWGNYGMAASAPENDYVHLLVNRMRRDSPVLEYRAEYIAAWEQNYTTYDKANFDAFFASAPDLILIRIGENVAYSDKFPDAFNALVAYVQTKAPTARIVVAGSFWSWNAAVDESEKSVATKRHLLYIPLSQLDNPTNRSTIGATVAGDDRAAHQINNSGVASHPSDAGMRAIADTIYGAMFSKSRVRVKFQ